MKGSSFEAGDRVYYVSGRHCLRDNNPLKGSRFECEGTVVGTNSSEGAYHQVQVNWDNCTNNSYNHSDLELISTCDELGHSDPNKAFRRSKSHKPIKRWI